MVTWEMDPLPGDVILAASKNPKWILYATLQLLTGSPSVYTHAALCLDNREYLDHRPGGAIIRKVEDLQERTSVAFSRNLLTDDQRSEIVRVARKYVGAPYTFWRFAYLGGHTIRAGRAVMSGLDRRCRGASICSELVGRIYMEAGVPVGTWDMDPRELSPGSLVRWGTWDHYRAIPATLAPAV